MEIEMTEKHGKICGIGVGPGDPELMTLKAVRRIREADIVCLPRENKEECRAYLIAVQSVPELAEKEILGFEFEMTSDPGKLSQIHRGIYDRVKAYPAEGKTVAFLTIGDPTIYSTVGYILKLAEADGIDTEIINGVTSFCAAAAACGEMISEGGEDIHILAGYEEEKLSLPGTKIIMKTGRRGGELKEKLLALEVRADADKEPSATDEAQSDADKAPNEEPGLTVFGASDCGLPAERIYKSASDLPEEGLYMTTLIVKER